MSRIVAQLLVAGATTVLRAASQAWHKALQNAHKSGVAQEAASTVKASTGGMSPAEARMILDVDPAASWVDVTKRYAHMMEVNNKFGSFYLQSKVFRAWEALDAEYGQQPGRRTPEDVAAAQSVLQHADGEQAQGEGQQAQAQQQQQQQQGGP
ncbi:PAM16L1 [Scenedesmus sp. PABB004]|nr:PAM16L1 [Scenedesmus sp. PABB004]